MPTQKRRSHLYLPSTQSKPKPTHPYSISFLIFGPSRSQILSVSLSLASRIRSSSATTLSQSHFDELSPLRPPPHLTDSSSPRILSIDSLCGVSNKVRVSNWGFILTSDSTCIYIFSYANYDVPLTAIQTFLVRMHV